MPISGGADFKKFSFIRTKDEKEQPATHFIQQDISKKLFEVDTSSIFPLFNAITHTISLDKYEISEDIKNLLEYDIIVKMSPKNRYSIQLKINDIKKGEPLIKILEDVIK